VNTIQRNPVLIFLINIIAIILAYYASLLLHEWGHGTVAWLNGVKSSPFDVQYGGWLLTNADENVNYDNLIGSGRGVAAALIGIAGFTVSFIFAAVCFILLNCKIFYQNSNKFTFAYWFIIINMIPMLQYLTVSVFSSEGDMGRFIHGLNFSAWWVFIPGTILIILAMWRILKVEIIKAYAIIPIKSILGQNIFLLATLGIIFLFIYTHGYNPFTDKGVNTMCRIMAIISVIFVPILFVFYNPSRSWVRKAVMAYGNKIEH
jgi:hypothetical protein